MVAETKEHIKNRMIKKAATMWDVPANEIEMSFDPVVALLISACASEMEKISNEVHQSQTRITEKLIQLMTPESVTGPKPAHGILKIFAVDETVKVEEEFMFMCRKSISNDKTSRTYKDLYFSPAQRAHLIDAHITHIASDNMVFAFDESKQKEVIFQHKQTGKLPPSTLYFGISSDIEELFLHDISFYIELLDVEHKDLFYHHLRNAKWSQQNARLNVIDGYYNSDDENTTSVNNIFDTVANKTTFTGQQILNNYRRNFVTVKEAKSQNKIKKSNFEELDTFLTENKIKVDPTLRWIKMEFPRIIPNSTLKNCFATLNAVPVINRELNTLSYKIKEFINILPIKTQELFFDIQSITNTSGDVYRARSKDNQNQDKGTFVLRNDNIGKLDQRKAREYVVHLIELLKDESASFSFMNNDFLNKNLKSLNQLLSVIEKKVSQSKEDKTETNYVFLTPYKPNEDIIVEYWTTHGNIANNIKLGTVLNNSKGVGVASSGNYMITTTIGGKDTLSMQDRLNAYRRSLLSRDRIVTKQDIIALCKEMYGNKLKSIEVKKGFTTGIGTNKGITQSIEIELKINSQIETQDEEWESLNNNLMLYLKKNSTNVFPYKIKLVN
ncbi:MAG: type VI secretion system baseplate subunit TssF [Patiriisocius sp.]|uniref:type VI secretion system baseplate subunit TssF n=1 Tax=Patiriisocius sp. TaxID=2822396 RepID=UPI003EF8189B